jgi:hypothetical protein
MTERNEERPFGLAPGFRRNELPEASTILEGDIDSTMGCQKFDRSSISSPSGLAPLRSVGNGDSLLGTALDRSALSRNTMFLGTTLRSPGWLESNHRQSIQYYTKNVRGDPASRSPGVRPRALWRAARSLGRPRPGPRPGRRVRRRGDRARAPFANSAMDGCALRAADTGAAPVRLDVVGKVMAGHLFEGTVQSGQSVRIMTGAPPRRGRRRVYAGAARRLPLESTS